MNGGRGGEECAKTGETPIFNQITHNLIPLERKKRAQKMQAFEKGLANFFARFRAVF